MRRSPALEAIWASGRYIGNNRANAYVTVNPTWHLAEDHSSASEVYAWWRVPFRRWAGTGSDIEVPRQVIKSIQIDRSITEDAGQCQLTIKNVNPSGGPNIAGQGHFSLRQASSPTGRPQSGWGNLTYPGTSASYGHFGPGSMFKTYEGYGGYNLSRSAALAAGNVVPTGVWIIDDTNVNSSGDLVCIARDLGSLLVDAKMYPPFMPDGCYPTQFYSETWNTEVNGDPEGFFPTVTNYRDIMNVCELIALWAGFHAPDGSGVLGHIEDTGIDLPAPIKHDFFDKKPLIDVIKELLKIVGYRAWVDQEGGLRMTSQNIWRAGNRLYNGGETGGRFTISELQTLTDFTAGWSRRNDRSHITASQGNPEIEKGVKHATWVAAEHDYRSQLRGVVNPAFFHMEKDLPLEDMTKLVELTAIRAWWSRHNGQIQAMANPLIDPDDQHQVVESTTWNTFLHRVKSISTTHTPDDGNYFMTIQSNWMGTVDSGWYVEVTEDGHVRYNAG